jgi:hypothetical protein
MSWERTGGSLFLICFAPYGAGVIAVPEVKRLPALRLFSVPVFSAQGILVASIVHFYCGVPLIRDEDVSLYVRLLKGSQCRNFQKI